MWDLGFEVFRRQKVRKIIHWRIISFSLFLFVNFIFISLLTPNYSFAYKRPLHISGRYFKDEENRVIQLRGFAVAGNSKLPPFQAVLPDELNPLPAMGVNVIRLLFNWEAFETERGVYNLDYLTYYDQLINRAAKLGIYVIIDMHQDGYSRYNIGGCGEGFPRWAVPDGFIKISAPNNTSTCGFWGLGIVFDRDLRKTWKLFYSDHGGVRTRFIQLWDFLSRHFSENDNVIGYDMLNEPGGNENTEIAPLYEEIAKVIREHDPGSILFVTPQVLTATGTPTKLKRPPFENFVYSPHYYSFAVTVFHSWFHMSTRNVIVKLQKKANEWGVPLFFGEFGSPNDVSGISGYINSLYNQLDRAEVGGTQWVFTPGWNKKLKDGWNGEDLSVTDETGKIRDNFRIHPFPTAIAGSPLEGGFKVDTGKTKFMSLRWSVGSDMVGKKTEIFAPRAIFDFGNDPSNLTTALTTQHLDCDFSHPNVITCVAKKSGVHQILIQ